MGGLGHAQSTLGWTDPVTIVGTVIGVLALGVISAVLVEKPTFSRRSPPSPAE